MNKTIITLTALATVGAASAATISVRVDQDTYIRNDAGPTLNNGDTDNELLLGSNNTDDNLRGLLGFDVSSITNDVTTTGGGDFANLTINSATLTIYERRGFSRSVTITVHDYSSSFLDTASTWNDPDGDGAAGTGDTTAGGTVGTLLGSQAITWDATADNQDAVFSLNLGDLASAIENADTLGSLNLMLRNSNGSPTPDFLSMTSDRSGTTSRHALLDIDYTVVPEPSSTALIGFAGLGLLFRRRR